ncbi:putative Flagellar basal-body protein [Verrucomicrobia bacterium]|nr:putative Flagellar basal-body protein [Verrucomicrobiota bacterium]
MKAFRFRLHVVLTLREQAEQAAQQNFARVCMAVRSAAARLASAEAALQECLDLCRRQLAASARATLLEQSRAYLLVLYERRARLARELAESRQREAQARAQLVIATQKREVLERLRAKQQRTHQYEAARAEQKFLDELARRAAPRWWARPSVSADQNAPVTAL